MDIDSYIEMFGGKIDNSWGGPINVNNTDFMQKMDELWKVLLDYKADWNSFTGILRAQLSVEKSLQASKTVRRQENKKDEDDAVLERFL